MAALLIAALTGAAPGPDARADGERRGAAVSEYGRSAVKSPLKHGTSHARPSASATPVPDEAALTDAEAASDAEADAGAVGTPELYEADPVPGTVENDYAPSGRGATTAATGEVSPVLPLGAGMTLIGLGLALIALRLRRA